MAAKLDFDPVGVLENEKVLKKVEMTGKAMVMNLVGELEILMEMMMVALMVTMMVIQMGMYTAAWMAVWLEILLVAW